MTDNWKILESEAGWEQILQESHQHPVAVFKHSTRCVVSSSVKQILEKGWDIPAENITFYFLDLIANRNISSRIAQDLQLRHESPQIILIEKGKVVFHESHFGIQMNAIKAAVA